MKGVLLPGNKEVRVADQTDPKPGFGEVLIRTRASAICRSDMSLYYGSPIVGGEVAGKGLVIPGHEADRWEEGVDSLAQIKRLVTELDAPNLGVCLAPPHLWVMGETISEAIFYLAERKKLFFYYIWDVDRHYRRGRDGLNFGPGEQQLPREDGTLDHRVLLRTLKQVGYEGVASLKCHGTVGWPLQKVTNQLATSAQYVRRCMADL